MNGWIAQDGNVRKVDAGSPATGLQAMDMKAVWTWCLRGLVAALSIGGLALAVDFLVRAQPTVGGVDFFFYLLYARDLAIGLPDVLPERYIYFPGVYTFWTFVFRVSDGSLTSLQWAYLAVLLVNGVLVGAILSTLTRRWEAGVVAASLYLVVASRIEGLEGITEPLATIPYLVGLWLWILLRERHRVPWDLAALGAGFGLALYCKQQAGLLALGAVGLLPAARSTFGAKGYGVRQLVLLPVAALVVFALAMIMEGGGGGALQRGLLFAQDYSASASWVRNVSDVFQATQPLSNMFLSSVVVWGLSVWTLRRRPLASATVVLALGLTVCSVLGGLLQYTKRGYLHYALLQLPPALIAAGLAIFLVARGVRMLTIPSSQLAPGIVAIGVVVFLGINSAGTGAFVQESAARIATVHEGPSQEELGTSFAPVCARVGKGAVLLTIPPRDNRIHWFCQTRSIAWKIPNPWEQTDPRVWRTMLEEPDLAQVFVFNSSFGRFERQFLGAGDWSGFLQELAARGYRRTLDSEVGQLYQRSSR